MMSDVTLRTSTPFDSLMVELLRQGADDGWLRPDIPYLVQVGENPVREVRCNLDQRTFLDHLEGLDYASEEEAQRIAQAALRDAVSGLLAQAGVLPYIEAQPLGRPLQLDLVVTAGELSALPFEFAAGPTGGWLFADEQRSVEITRRVRLGFSDRSNQWPARPRILFIAASPRKSVPAEENKAALRQALKPWIEPFPGSEESIPDASKVLDLLEKASLGKIRQRCAQAADEGKPFTHVHILAHGIDIVTSRHQAHYGIALHGDEGGQAAVEPTDLADALRPIVRDCVVITLAICNSGDGSNTLRPASSIAHALHAAGTPVVVASQFPLTAIGSTIFAETFYRLLLEGEDVRAALHATRLALHTRQEQTLRDWAALVGYVRLPENYQSSLIETALEADLAALRTAHRWFDHIRRRTNVEVKDLITVAASFQDRIDQLRRRVSGAEERGRKGALEENLGLLGSGEKRLAEVQFRLLTATGNQTYRQAMLASLGRSREWYLQSFQANLSHHWTGVQALSLSAVLFGRIENRGLWHAAVAAAEFALEKDFWAAGSLAELHMLSPVAGQGDGLEKAAQYIALLAHQSTDAFAAESTIQQLERYRSWWTGENGFFCGSGDLARQAGLQIDELKRRLDEHAEHPTAEVQDNGS